MINPDAIVIGSGPASTLCAKKLVENNVNTLMIDYGLELEKNKKELVKELKLVDKKKWNQNHRYKLHQDKSYQYSGIPLKLIFGSDFPYSKAIDKLNLILKDIEYFPSLAKGGLSNVWGGSILPYKSQEFYNWPIKLKDLENHYKYVLNEVGISCQNDDLRKIFPTYAKSKFCLNNSSQTNILKKINKKYQAELENSGLYVGMSRLAVSQKNHECIYCGSCLYGCVHSLIYNSANDLNKLIKYDHFKYQNCLLVEKFIEKENYIQVISKSTSGKKIIINSKRVYIGAGVLSTSKIVLNSYNENIEKRKTQAIDSQYFFLPAIMFSSSKDIHKEKLHTLCQYFIEVQKQNFIKEWAHLQIYTYNDLFYQYLKKKLGIFYLIFGKIIEKFFLGRIIFIQGFLHSDLSSKAELKLKKNNDKIFMTVKQIRNKYTKKNIKEIINLLKIGKFGRGFHSGGTFKMSLQNNQIGKTDIWGRPFSFKRAHIIDSSIFPTIPSTTITLTAMANAVRIADNHKNF